MKFMRDFAGAENFVESGGAGVETEIIFRTAIEINFQAGERSSACQSERAVALPERRIGRDSENAAKDSRATGGGGTAISGKEYGKFFNERGAVGADGREQLRMSESKMQSAVTAHGNAGDGAIRAAGARAVVALDERKKFLQQEILVADFAVTGVDVKAGCPRRSGDQKILELPFFAEVFDEIPASGVEKRLLVVAKSMEEIEDWKAPRFVGVKAGWQENAIWNRAREDLAWDRVALDAAGSGRSTREVKEVQGAKEVKEQTNSSLRSRR
jgi:hypothetical protein